MTRPAGDTDGDSRRGNGLVRRAIWLVFVLLVFVGLVTAGQLPLHTYLDNQAAIAETRDRLDELQASNQRMRDDLARLSTDEELERVAREQYGLVKPGEEVYHVQQPAEDPVAVPDAWPFSQLHDRLQAVDPTTDGIASTTTTTVGTAASTVSTAPPTTSVP